MLYTAIKSLYLLQTSSEHVKKNYMDSKKKKISSWKKNNPSKILAHEDVSSKSLKSGKSIWEKRLLLYVINIRHDEKLNT